MGDPPASVLCVCTANVCRSPAAELLLRTGLQSRLGAAAEEQVAVASAGTWATARRPIEPGTAAALRRTGVGAGEVAAALSTRLTQRAVVAADLVLASTAEHVRAVWRYQLAARHRTFTLGELVRLTEGVPRRRPAGRGRRRPAAGPGGPGQRAAGAAARPRHAVRERGVRPGRPDRQRPGAAGHGRPDGGWVDLLLDVVAGPAPARRAVRDRVPGVARALQWSRHRAARGAVR